MTSKFDNVPVEEDTRILLQQPGQLGQYDVLYQKWHWDGVTAESFIFANEDVAGIEEEQIIKEVRSSPLVREGSKTTVSISDSGFTFVNFNFVT